MDTDPVIEPLGPKLAARVARFVTEHRLPGASVGIVRDGRLAWTAMHGFADFSTGARPDAQTLYRIASITKTFTATAILQLRDDGRLQLDDPLVAHVPEFAQAADPFGLVDRVTIRRLLTHRSGLQSELPVLDPRRVTFLRPDELVGMLDRVRVVIPPDSQFKYSNLGFELLGEVVHRVSGQPYPTYVAQHVTGPLGMRATVHEPTGELHGWCAVGYDARGYEDRCATSRDIDSLGMSASAGLWSSVEDLACWVGQQSRRDDDDRRGPGQVLDGPSLREMHQPLVLNDPGWTEANGFGWYVTREDGVDWVGHSGTMFGFTSNVVFEPAEGLGAIVLLNGIGPADRLARSLCSAVLDTHRDARAMEALPKSPPGPTPAAWEQLIGTYRDEAFAWDVRVECQCEELVCVIPDSPHSPHRLSATEDPLVFTVGGGRYGGESATFLCGSDGRIDGLNLAGNPLVRLAALA